MDFSAMFRLESATGNVATYRTTRAFSITPRMAMLWACGQVSETVKRVVILDASGALVAEAQG